MGAGSLMVNATVVSQPFPSVTVTVQGPAQSPETLGVPCPEGGAGAQRKEYTPVPPTGATSAVPSHPPKQVASVNDRLGSMGVTLRKKVVSNRQLFASVTSRVFGPAQSWKAAGPVS